MLRIGLIRERKNPPDNRVPLTPLQCKRIKEQYPDIDILVETAPDRCYTDDEYANEGITVTADMSNCDILLGVKEVPVDHLIPGKTYFFFSHTKKKQPYNQPLMHALIDKKIRMIDYECLTYADEQRILGFGQYAGIVGAHNGVLTYGKKLGIFELPKANLVSSFRELVDIYRKMRLPALKIVVTGSGKVAAGAIEVMTNLDIDFVEPEDYLTHQYDYPVYTQLTGSKLYARKDNDQYYRDDFHAHPENYKCLFTNYITQTDILINGIYWDNKVARLFEKNDVKRKDWRIKVIADVTCDINGSVPINVGATTISDPVYGINRETLEKTEPYQNTDKIIDVMAIDNLPNELPRDASQFFGAHFEKYILKELLDEDSDIIRRATICEGGKLTSGYEYLSDYAYK